MPVQFPPIENATEEGLVAVGGKLDLETLSTAYLSGIFPWPIQDVKELTWFSPDPRGIIEVNDYKVPKSFKKFLAKSPYRAVFNQDFNLVIQNCASVPRTHETGTWITDEIVQAYTNLFNHKKAYCVSVYNEQNELVGGLYGVHFGEIISGESMFHKEDNASKFALLKLLEFLEIQNIPFLDTQMTTGVIESFGGITIPREQYLKRLRNLDPNRTTIF